MRKTTILLTILLLNISVKAQEMWGISNSNFSGNMGIFLNPTTIVGAPYQYEINLVALDVFSENTGDYYDPDTRVIGRTLTGGVKKGDKYFVNGLRLQDNFSHTLIIGPSYIRNKTQSAWGIHTAYRSEISVLKMSPSQALLLFEGFQSPSLFNTRVSANPFNSAYASWLELGGTYGKVFRESEHHLYKYAANVNILAGLNGFYYDQKSFDFTVVDSSQTILHNMDATYAHSLDPDGGSYFGLRGVGLSTTLGFTYINHPNRGAFDCTMANDKQRKYKYRLGLSILDLGMIRYSGNATNVTVKASDYTWNRIDTARTETFNDINSAFFTNVPTTIEKKSFGIILPFALGMQFDYQLKPNIFANASVIKRVHFAANQIARGDQVNISARYERRRYEAALSFSLFEYRQPAVGLGLRYRFIVIGTDRLLQLAGLSDTKSFDLFFGIKFQFCKKPFSPGPDCPAFN